MRSDSSASRIKVVDEFTKTQPILETLLFEIRDIAKSVKSIQQHLDLQDSNINYLSAQVNLAGNLAADSRDTATEALNELKKVNEIVSRMDQTLFGVTELAKSGFDIATALRSVVETDRPPAIDDDPVLEVFEF